MKIKKHSIDDIWAFYWGIVAFMAVASAAMWYAENQGWVECLSCR